MAFDKGVNRLGTGWSELRAQLVTGRGVALGCSGLRNVGGEDIASVPPQYSEMARKFFGSIRFAGVCAGPALNGVLWRRDDVGECKEVLSGWGSMTKRLWWGWP
ncbi:hypothetical protein HC891_26905, partial [Candidatus Gracilibacteria bacterium]|nr:hypothetical protein [Candidatus Gracilibacteria bacterium]